MPAPYNSKTRLGQPRVWSSHCWPPPRHTHFIFSRNMHACELVSHLWTAKGRINTTRLAKSSFLIVIGTDATFMYDEKIIPALVLVRRYFLCSVVLLFMSIRRVCAFGRYIDWTVQQIAGQNHKIIEKWCMYRIIIINYVKRHWKIKSNPFSFRPRNTVLFGSAAHIKF